MNKLYKIFSLLAFAFIITSCEDSITLLPEQELDESKAFASVASTTAALNGVYSQAQLIEVFGSQPATIEDYMSDNVLFVGSFPTFQDIFNYVTTTDNVSVRNIWQVHYRVINGANLVIDNVGNVDDPAATQEWKDQITGQAKFLRAITYFQLVNQFAHPINFNNGQAPGVPLVLTGFTGEVSFPARATVAEVHTQIAADLNDAITLLGTSGSAPTRATAAAAAGYLSRLHLYRGEYAQAAQFANTVISGGNHTPATNLDFYDSQGSEWIFVISNTAVDNGATGAGGWASYYRPASAGGRGDCPMTDDLANLYMSEAGDLRLSQLADSVVCADQVRRLMSKKYPDTSNSADDSPLLRVSEVMLTRAESLLRTSGFSSEVLDLVNPIRTRAGLAAWDANSFSGTDAWIEAVLNERRKELAFEGHRRMDILRLGRSLRPGSTGTNFGDTRTVLPIPQREIDINSSLVQNPGYE